MSGTGINYGSWLACLFQDLKRLLRDLFKVMFQHVDAIDQDQHAFEIGPLLDPVNILHTFLPSGITTYAPDGIGGVEYDPT